MPILLMVNVLGLFFMIGGLSSRSPRNVFFERVLEAFETFDLLINLLVELRHRPC